MSNNYRVRVYKENFDFSAGHFITFGGLCETLHGHNYRVEVQLTGENGPDRFLYNFSDLKPVVRDECANLDHRMLLAMKNPLLEYKESPDEIEVRFGSRRYLFPLAEVALLPVENTTAEELAAYLLGRIRQRLQAQKRPELSTLRSIEVGVEEQPGQMAYYAEYW
ncbi:MAG TPA: 6-carboxytetrahydropterin synthase [Chloroflexia bacterium]|nr:6-carboxytetrahydropterin synthase [Chloroflexia bacterium]